MYKWHITYDKLAYADTWYTRHNNKRKALQEWREHWGLQGKKLYNLEIWRD